MNSLALKKIDALAAEPEAMNCTIECIASCLRRFIRPQENVLICFPRQQFGCFAEIVEKAVSAADGTPVLWEPDCRWKTLLRQAFMLRVATVIAPPLIILGLSKIAKATGTPLYIRNVLPAGYPSLPWLTEGIQKGLDCRIWYCDGLDLSFADPENTQDPSLAKIGEMLQSWTSVLDCRLQRGPYGLEMEVVIFPGEKLPRLPSCAKQIVRSWQPECDEPFWWEPLRKNTEYSGKSH